MEQQLIIILVSLFIKNKIDTEKNSSFFANDTFEPWNYVAASATIGKFFNFSAYQVDYIMVNNF